MVITIHKTDICPASRAVLMIAEFIQLNYQTQALNFPEEENTEADPVEKNPLRASPLLEDRDFILEDSHAIITYLVSKYGADLRAELYPSDLALRATIDQRLFFDASVLFPNYKAIVTSVINKKSVELDEKEIVDVDKSYEVLEKYLEESRFVACDYLTLADVSIAATVSTMEVLVPVDEKYERVHAWLNRLKDQEWYQKINVPGLNKLVEMIKVLME